MERYNLISVISGCLSGVVGSILVSEFNSSLLFVGIVGVLVGTGVAFAFSFFDKKSEKKK